MSQMTADNASQYGDSRKLAARARLNGEYTIAEIGWFPWVAKRLPLKSGDRVLDIGCGPGWFWAAIAGAVPDALDLTLADLSLGMVREAVDRCRYLPFSEVRGVQTTAAELPFEEASFDAVIAMHMLYHLPDPAKAIAEMFRVLKPGGILAVTTNGAGNMRELYTLTTVLGSEPFDPAAAAFGFDAAKRMMSSQFSEVSMREYPAKLRITEPDDVFLALTSYPPGDSADEIQLKQFREAITSAFEQGGGVLETKRETALFLSRKPTRDYSAGNPCPTSTSRYELAVVETSSDWESYHAIRQIVLFEARGRHDYDPNGPEERKQENLSLLLKHDGIAIGTVRLDLRPEKVGSVRLVAIQTQYQLRGHGRVLLQKTEELARNLGVEELRVYGAPEAAGFYEKLGYSRFAFDAGTGGIAIQLRKVL